MIILYLHANIVIIVSIYTLHNVNSTNVWLACSIDKRKLLC
jgi:hypothetical protein